MDISFATPRPPAAATDTKKGKERLPRARRRDVPVLFYRITVGLLVGLTATGPGGVRWLVSPWADTAHLHPGLAFELHRWHMTDVTALVSLLLIGSLLTSALRPRAWILPAQAFLATTLAMAAVTPLMPDPAELLKPAALLVGLVFCAHPRRGALLRPPAGLARRWLTTIAAVVATPFLATNAWENLTRQISGLDEHAMLGHWGGAAALALALLLVGWLATTTAPGARAVSFLVAGAYAYLGAAALTLPAHDGSWAVPGGLVALALAALFLAGTWMSPVTGDRR